MRFYRKVKTHLLSDRCNMEFVWQVDFITSSNEEQFIFRQEQKTAPVPAIREGGGNGGGKPPPYNINYFARAR